MKIQLERCPFCGGIEFIEARQAAPETYVTAQTYWVSHCTILFAAIVAVWSVALWKNRKNF